MIESSKSIFYGSKIKKKNLDIGNVLKLVKSAIVNSFEVWQRVAAHWARRYFRPKQLRSEYDNNCTNSSKFVIP